MKTFKETFDENIWDRTKAKAAADQEEQMEFPGMETF